MGGFRDGSLQVWNEMNANNVHHRSLLQGLARRAMVERGLIPDFSAEALAELAGLKAPAMNESRQAVDVPEIRDLRDLIWASIDTDDSRDLDQLTVAEALPADTIKILVAIADVDSIVK